MTTESSDELGSRGVCDGGSWHERLNKRLVKVVQQWADKPTQSIPTAAGGWGDMAAAYRMLDNKRCDWREILEAHSQCTTQRMAALPVVLCLTDRKSVV